MFSRGIHLRIIFEKLRCGLKKFISKLPQVRPKSVSTFLGYIESDIKSNVCKGNYSDK